MSWHGDCRKGPPLILQSDNGREFLNLVARSGSNNGVTDAQGQAAGAGACLGNSPSNGGSERFNRTIEEKVPYVAVFGQVPRVGLQSLRLSDDLANSLTTEADLNAALGLPEDKAIDDDSPAASEPRAEDAAAPPTDG
mmetsp:Transcript_24568/g.63826  ORF Transcript_24568/g.63826 Transcript_24568/m.63826 type:complete len:138 (+) Transcript_24568:478-891(+)